MPYKDKAKAREFARNWMNEYYKRDEAYRERAKATSKKVKKVRQAQARQIIAEETRHGCAVCGEKTEACLTFHHLNPNEKQYGIWQLKNLGILDALKAELKKCVCLCANCHRKVHAGTLVLLV